MLRIISNKNYIFFITGIISLLISFWICANENVLNSDAICYLQSAADMKLGLYTAMHLCDQAKWPFYSALIYFFTQITPFSLTFSAFMLNAVFSLFSSLMFLAIVRFITPNVRILLFAAFVILLSHEFNSVKQYIIRDHGFWALYLSSIFFLLKFLKEKKWYFAVAWSISTLVATLFRVEGIIFLVLIPLISFFDSEAEFTTRIKSYFQLNAVTLLSVIALLGWTTFHPEFDVTRLHEVKFQFTHGFFEIIPRYFVLKQSLAEHVLGPDSARDAGMVLVLMLASWFQVSIVLNVSLIFFVLVIYAWHKKLMPATRNTSIVLWAYLIVNLLITILFFSEHMFLSKRYLIALSLILMLWVPFALEDLMLNWQKQKTNYFLIAIFLILVSALGGIFNFGYSKQYIRNAGDWLASHAPANAKIYSNDYQVLYYSKHFGDDLFVKAKAYGQLDVIANDKWKQFDFIALNVRQKDNKKEYPKIGYAIAQTFANKRGDTIIIYRRDSL